MYFWNIVKMQDLVFVLVWLISMRIIQTNGELPTAASSINCLGAWSNCTSINGKLECNTRFGIKPFQSTVCRIRNACIANGEIELYADSPYTLGFHGSELALSPFSATHRLGMKGNIRINVSSYSKIPNNDTGLFDHTTGVLVENTDNKNIGHVYGDEIWPVFQMLHRYRYDWRNSDFRLILRNKNEAYKHQIYELVSNYAPAHITGVHRQCFNELFVGSNAMSYSESSPDPNALISFRDFLIQRAQKIWGLNIQTSPFGFSDRVHPNILLVVKDVKHSAHPTLIKNHEAAVEALKQHFPKLEINTLTWYGKSQREQIQIMQKTDILYSQPGSDVMNAIFLPSGSTLITPCRALDASWITDKRSSSKRHVPTKVLIEYGNEVRIWFNAMPDMRCIQVCGDEDITFEKNAYMIPGTIHIENLIKTMSEVVEDWRLRRANRF